MASMQLGVNFLHHASRSRSFNLLRTLTVCFASAGAAQILKVPVSSRTMFKKVVSRGALFDEDGVGSSVFFISAVDFSEDLSKFSN